MSIDRWMYKENVVCVYTYVYVYTYTYPKEY